MIAGSSRRNGNQARRRHYVEVQGLVKRFGNDRAVDDVSFSVPKGNFLTLLGPSGCGKTTTLMSIAGLHRIDAGRIRVGGVVYTSPADGIFLRAGEARHRHGVPELRDLAAHDASRRTSPTRWRSARSSAPRSTTRVADVLRLVGLGQMAEQARYPALGRPAAAHGAGARDRVAAAPAAVRRAAVQSRSEAARADAGRTQAHPARGRHHLDLRHPRPVRGAGHERRDHRDEQRPHPAEGRPARDLRPAGQRLCQQLHRRRQSAEGPRGRGQRARAAARSRSPKAACDAQLACRLARGMAAGAEAILSVRPENVRGHCARMAADRASKARCSRRSSSAIASTVACAGATFEWKVMAHPRTRLRKGEKVYLRLDPEHTLAVRP